MIADDFDFLLSCNPSYAGPLLVAAPDAGPARGRVEYEGRYDVECYDAEGNLKWRDVAYNGVTSNGLDLTLNVMFRSTSALTTWYIGLVDNAGWTGWNLADTMASHASPNAWAESVAYSDSTRGSWSPGAPSGNAIVNSTTVDFNMTATVTIKGLFLTSDSTKGGSSGTLWSTASFSGGTQLCNTGDKLKVTYTISAANSASNI